MEDQKSEALKSHQSVASTDAILAALDRRDLSKSCHQIGHELSNIMQALDQSGRAAEAIQIDRERRICLLTVRATISNFGNVSDSEREAGRFTGIAGFADGSVFPNPDTFSDEDLDYFRTRVAVTANPVLQARYNDFLFDKGRYSAESRGQKFLFGLAAIDAYLDSAQLFADADKVHSQIEMVNAMDQAAYLAIHLQNRVKITAVVSRLETLLTHQFAPALSSIADDGARGPKPIGRWSIELSHILLYIKASKKFGNLVDRSLVERVRDTMSDLAARNASAGLLHLQGHFLDVATEAAHLLGDTDGIYSLQLRDAEALAGQAERAAQDPAPRYLVAAKFYEDAALQYSWMRQNLVLTTDVRKDIEQRENLIKQRIREMYRLGRGEMKTFTAAVEISADELSQMLDEVLASDDLSEALQALAMEGSLLPNLELARASAAERLSQGSLLSLIPKRTIRDNIAIGNAASDEERLANETDHDLLMWISINSGIVLKALFERLRERNGLTAEVLAEYLFATDLFDADNLELIRIGLERHFASDFVSALHVLVPQFEDVVRTLFERTGEVVIRPRTQQAGWEFETFGAFLNRPSVKAVMPAEMWEYIRLVLTEPTGWNLRNRIAHGLARPQECTEEAAVTVLHLFLLLTLFRRSTHSEDEGDMPRLEPAIKLPEEVLVSPVTE